MLFGCVDLGKPWQLQTVSLQMVGWEPKSFPYLRDVQSGFFHGASAVGYFAASALTRNLRKNAWVKVGFIKTGDPTVHKGVPPKEAVAIERIVSPFCCMSCSHLVSCSPVLCAWVGVC